LFVVAAMVVIANKYMFASLLSQAIRAAACISFGTNISAKSVYLTSLYPTALTSTNDHFTVLRHSVCTFGGTWRYELSFFIICFIKSVCVSVSE